MEHPDPIVIELNPEHRRLYDRMRAWVVMADRGEASGPRDLLLLLPDLAVLLARLYGDARVPRRSKWVASLAIAYVLSPIDLLPALLLGPLGLVDDLLVVAGALSLMVNRVHPDVIRHHWPGQGDALQAIQSVAGWAEPHLGTRLQLFFRSLPYAGKRPSGT